MRKKLTIDKSLHKEKAILLSYFRNRANEILNELALQFSAEDYKEKATEVNHAMGQSKETLVSNVLDVAKNERWTNEDILRCMLMITYTNDVVMLETRNMVWKYEYMTFSRRIGELWEPFCKLCFDFPQKSIRKFLPPLFSDVKQDLTNEIDGYIDGLKITAQQKAQLRKYYDKVWTLVTSGEIKLECDLHFTDKKTKYIVDFKSGFGSNEKGNTNRLLLVGSIYNNIETEKYKCLLFVRSKDHNHYLDTLRNSGVWAAYCGGDTYTQIKKFTGFDIQGWIKDNVKWMQDFTPQMVKAIKQNKLEEYLQW